MKRFLIIFVTLFIALIATNECFAAKKKPFYDAKSQLLGISGDLDSLSVRGFGSKIFANKIKINRNAIPRIEIHNRKKGWNDEQVRTIVEELNRQRVGHQVLEVLFPLTQDEHGNVVLSKQVMNERALANAQFTDIEKANAGMDSASILRDDWTPILKNNYIYLEQRIYANNRYSVKQAEDFVDFIVLYVDINDDIIQQIYANWTNPIGFEKINPEIKFLYTGAEKLKNPQKFQRKLAENVPAFAIRGQLTGRNPATARIGTINGLEKGDMVSIYRQSMNANGEMVSNRVSRARVSQVNAEDCRMYFISGTKGSYKDGDMVVRTPDKNMGMGIYGNYSLGRFFGGSITWDYTGRVTNAGLANKILVQCKLDYADYEKLIYEPENYGPFIFDINLGYGLSWTCLGRIEIMPFALVGFELITAPGREVKSGTSKKTYPSITGYGARAAGGLRIDVNIVYPVKLSFGAEYAHTFSLDKVIGKNGEEYYNIFTDAFKLNGMNGKKSLNRNGINFFAGLRFVF